MQRVLKFAAYAALGPITGPLVAGMIRNWRSGDRILAGLYVVALASVYVLLPVAAAQLMSGAGP